MFSTARNLCKQKCRIGAIALKDASRGENLKKGNKKVRKKEKKYSLKKKATKKTIKKKNYVFLGRVLGRERVKKITYLISF